MLLKQLNIRKRMIKLQYDYGAIHNDSVSDFGFGPDADVQSRRGSLAKLT